MKRTLNLTILLFLLSSLTSNAQDSTNVYNFDFHKLKPIVQVFGTASYNFDENKMFSVSELFQKNVELPKGTFDWHNCSKCNEIVFDNQSKIIDGKRVCIPCSEK